MLLRVWMDGGVEYVVGFCALRLDMSFIGSLRRRDLCFSPGTDNVICTMCNKVCKPISGLNRHVVVHKHQIPQA